MGMMAMLTLAIVIRNTWALRLLLFVALAQPQARAAEYPQPPSNVGVAVGCTLVLGATAIIVFKVIPFCKKHFDKPKTNATEFWLSASGDGDSWAAMSCSHGKDCPSDLLADGNAVDTVVEITGRLVASTSGVMVDEVAFSRRRAELVVGEDQWRADLHELGLGNGYGSGSSYSRNGIPCSSDAVPIQFQADGTAVMLIDGPKRQLWFERSTDLENWRPIFSAVVPVGYRVALSDMPETQAAFYRIRITE